MNQHAHQPIQPQSNGQHTYSDREMDHWTSLRRSMLMIVAAIHRAIPNGSHTLDVQIVPRNKPPPV